MTVPVWMLLGDATWSVLLLLTTVGVYRWSRILTGRAPIREFRADRVSFRFAFFFVQILCFLALAAIVVIGYVRSA